MLQKHRIDEKAVKLSESCACMCVCVCARGSRGREAGGPRGVELNNKQTNKQTETYSLFEMVGSLGNGGHSFSFSQVL